MVFSSAAFLFAFLPLTLAGYYFLPIKYRNVFLMLASLLFYAWGEPKFVFVMILSILMNYAFGLLVDTRSSSCLQRDVRARRRYRWRRSPHHLPGVHVHYARSP